MDDDLLDAFNEGLRSVNEDAYIRTDDGEDFILDGHFTLDQLKALILQIELHQAQAR